MAARPMITSDINKFTPREFKLKKVIGVGLDSKAYLAEFTNAQTGEKQELACKVYDLKKMSKLYVDKFLPRELESLINIVHPHIIYVHSIFQQKTKCFIFMRYAENGDLFDYVKHHGPVTEAQARIWFRQLSLALQYLHNINIIHRDIKCENILITKNYNVKLADFGFSRYILDDAGKSLKSETYCGSLPYAAPEIVKGAPYDPKPTDIWSLGVVLYVMVNKAMPFDETSLRKLYLLQQQKRWKFKSRVEADLTTSLKRLITQLLEPDPDKRYNIENVLKSEWILADPKLSKLSASETEALVRSRDKNREYRKYPEKTVVTKEKQANESSASAKNKFQVIKEVSGHNRVSVEQMSLKPTISLPPEIITRKKCCIL